MPANFAEIAVQCLSAPLSAAEAAYIAHTVKNMEGFNGSGDKNGLDILPCRRRKTHNKIREDTEMKNIPLYCPKYKQETLIDVKGMNVVACKI